MGEPSSSRPLGRPGVVAYIRAVWQERCDRSCQDVGHWHNGSGAGSGRYTVPNPPRPAHAVPCHAQPSHTQPNHALLARSNGHFPGLD